MSEEKAGMLIVLCFDVRNKAHIAHLQTKSYAQHIAFNEFYDGIIPLADSFAESWQGRNGIIESYVTINSNSKGLESIKSLRRWVYANRVEISKESELQNIIDEIISLCNSTVYKLETFA